jgi:sorting nexin-41/42
MTQDALEARREQLGDLEKHEREARRLDAALSRSTIRSLPNTPNSGSPTEERGNAEEEGGEVEGGERAGVEGEEGREGQEEREEYGTRSLPPHPGPNPVKRRAPGMGLLSALSYTLHGMMDADPEAARRSGISKTRETISNVSICFHLFYWLGGHCRPVHSYPRNMLLCCYVLNSRSRSLTYENMYTARGRAPSLCTGSQVCELDDPG